jgi:hypothetical protein
MTGRLELLPHRPYHSLLAQNKVVPVSYPTMFWKATFYFSMTFKFLHPILKVN